MSTKELYYVVEDANWSIKNVGEVVTSKLKHIITSKITITHYGIRNSIIHYGSINTFLGQDKIKLPHKSNKVIVTWFHVVPDENRFNLIKEAVMYIDIWHTSCEVTQRKMINLGIPKNKIVLIPLGVDLKHFKPIELQDKNKLKNKLKIPSGKVVLGSFQKDGNGWDEGLLPKLIKGPDVFCDVVEKLFKKYDLFVLLTGPARGYVKKRLDSANIPYMHEFFDNSNEVAEHFKAIDLYMVTSREEGGPKSILESMACGIPLISTRVGMAEDIIENEKNGFLVDIEDVDGIYIKACNIIDNNNLANTLIQNGLKKIENYDSNLIAQKYYEKLYKELI